MDSSTPLPTSALPIISNHPIQSPSPSPSTSPLRRRSKTCLADRLEITADDSPEPARVRRRRKARVAQNNAQKARKPRAGADVEIREESKDSVVGLFEEIGKPRKRAVVWCSSFDMSGLESFAS
ncbi:unnamed protein product [Vicia faba]|uniref:Uncharacterized protein n=1 Tax=Vicia faba TaxID=3906 RepID=A0AAV0ZWQ9_VICFA|nr:unnamed protein product [Vicia faba]